MEKSPAWLSYKLAGLPRIKLAFLPTPFQELPRFAKELGGPRIFMKRDDLTGLAFGGNKTRMFEYLLAEIRGQGADTVIGGAMLQSNYCRQLAAACNAAGFEVHLVLRKLETGREVNFQGNLLLDLLAGARIHIIEGGADNQRRAMYLLAERLKTEGKKPYVVRMANDEDLTLDVASYINCFCELMEQTQGLGLKPTYLYTSSYDSTQAGLEVGNRVLGNPLKIIGISPEVREDPASIRIAGYANQAAEHLQLGCVFHPDEIINCQDYVGGGYGLVSAEGLEMIRLVLQTEGVLLDPVYTAKAMAALADHVKKRRFKPEDQIVFLHTGGTPALFAYQKELLTAEMLDAIDYSLPVS